jgi:hypothetical protein
MNEELKTQAVLSLSGEGTTHLWKSANKRGTGIVTGSTLNFLVTLEAPKYGIPNL